MFLILYVNNDIPRSIMLTRVSKIKYIWCIIYILILCVFIRDACHTRIKRLL